MMRVPTEALNETYAAGSQAVGSHVKFAGARIQPIIAHKKISGRSIPAARAARKTRKRDCRFA
jgi:hypothetical protein